MRLGALATLVVALLGCGQPSISGAPDGGTSLPANVTPADVARTLAHFLWNAAPDEALTKAVYDQPPATTADVRRLAGEMLGDPRGRDGLREFFHEWLQLDRLATAKKDPAAYPEWTPALRDAMIAEAETFALHVTFDGDSRLRTLMTADFGLLNETTAPLYGVKGVNGPELRKVSLPAEQRAGVFTLAGVLAGARDASKPLISSRGAFVMSLMGMTAPPEPPGLPAPPPPDPGQTMRAQQEMTVGSSPACSGCHSLIDPPGVAFGHYDALGRYQETENGLVIDASGTFDNNVGNGLAHPFDGPRELADMIFASPQLADNFVVRLFTFAGARQDGEALLDARTAFERRGFDLRELILDVASSRALLAPQ
jgi:hypothetical protein